MSYQKQIKVRIFPDGQVQAVVSGIPGKKCTEYISILEELLDAEVIDSEPTAEYYLNPNVLSEMVDTAESGLITEQTKQSGLV